jgi:hypothetical protein
MFSYRQVICNRGTLNGRILRFGGRTGVLRSSYQAALQVAALHIGALQINALQINDCDQFFRWTPRQASAIIATSSHLLCKQPEPTICLQAMLLDSKSPDLVVRSRN